MACKKNIFPLKLLDAMVHDIFFISKTFRNKIQLLFDVRSHLRLAEFWIDALISTNKSNTELCWNNTATSLDCYEVSLANCVDMCRNGSISACIPCIITLKNSQTSLTWSMCTAPSVITPPSLRESVHGDIAPVQEKRKKRSS